MRSLSRSSGGLSFIVDKPVNVLKSSWFIIAIYLSWTIRRIRFSPCFCSLKIMTYVILVDLASRNVLFSRDHIGIPRKSRRCGYELDNSEEHKKGPWVAIYPRSFFVLLSRVLEVELHLQQR